MGLVKEGTS